eukprot:2998090-Rhodomonas_salina.2
MIGDAGAEALAGVLGDCTALAYLRMNRNGISTRGARRLAGVLGECQALAYLDLRRNEIDFEGAKRLAKAFFGTSALANLRADASKLYGTHWIGARNGTNVRPGSDKGLPQILV